MSKPYTDEERVEALAQAEAHGGVTRAAAAAASVPLTTLEKMVIIADRSVQPNAAPPRAGAFDYVAAWGAVQERALAIVRANLERFETMELSVSQTKDVQVMAAIASDKHLDHRDGRKGALLLDNSQHLTLPPGTTLDDLRALRDDLRAQAALDAPAETPGYVAQ